MHRECFACDIKQINKISQILSLDKELEELLLEKINNYLRTCDMSKTNPEIMKDIWQIISSIINNDNPYNKIKKYYNKFLLSLLSEIEQYIGDDLNRALKVTIAANLIDFSAKDNVNDEEIKNQLLKANDMILARDDSTELFTILEKSSQLLYIGDNCGEIVLDKLFITILKHHYPQLNVYYGVRGKPIVNDVTIDDAMEIKMDEVAQVISNGDGSLGTVLTNVSQEFKEIYESVDVVICKGQGNYEGLVESNRDNLYFLFMVKCQLVANMSKTHLSDIVCMKNSCICYDE